MPTKQRHVVVIGAGPGGLTAAMILAHRGLRVTVLEARNRVGGRNAAIELGPYSFDVGPTFLMLKNILDEVFHEAGAACDATMDMRRLDPMYRLQFADKHVDVSSDPDRMKAEIARCFPGRERHYDAFLKREGERFRHLLPCLQKSYHKLSTLTHPDLLRALPHLAAGRSLFDVMYGCFGDEQLALAFTFQAKYLGMSPWMCPGLFSIIPYIEHAFGVFHPIGGLSRISESMADVVRRQGGTIRLATPVRKVVCRNRAATGVEIEGGERIEADDVVINADFGHAMRTLFEPGVLRRYVPARLDRMKLSCSTFMLYLGLDRAYDAPHHLVCFAKDYRANVQAVFEGKRTGSDVSFYMRNAGVTDDSLAPSGHTALYVLAPVANLRGEPDWAREKDACREVLLDAIAQRSPYGDVRAHIREAHVITPPDWRDEYRVFEGATFNLAHNIGQMVYWRPHNKFEDVGHCYLVGGGTHPGSGLPTIYESGRIAANLICRSHGIRFMTANLHV